jgi:hypothetical protein
MGKINIKEANKGKFTAWAQAHGMTVQQAAATILRNREKYSSALIKRANFARNAAKWDEGGVFLPEYKSGGIHINPVNKGKFNATKKATGKTTEELTHSKNPKTRKRAIFAQNAKKWHHSEGGEINNFGIGGVMSIAQGALGFLQQIEQQQEQKQLMAEQAKQSAITNANAGQNSILSNFPPVFKVGGQFKGKKFGGTPNAVVGGGEIVITPDGVPTNMQGPTDMNGGQGIDVALPDKSIILSKKSSKDLLPLTSKINKSTEVLKGNGATMFAKNSAKRNLDKYMSTMMDAYNNQELKKMSKGGRFDGGGWKAPQLPGENRTPYWPQGGLDALQTIYDSYMPHLRGTLGNADVTAQGIHSAGEAQVVAKRRSQSDFWDNSGINPYNFYNNAAKPSANQLNVPQGGIYNPGVASPMFGDPSWWNRQNDSTATNMATDPRFGNFTNIPESTTIGANTPSGVSNPTLSRNNTTSPSLAPSVTGKNTWAGNIGGMNQHLDDITKNFELAPSLKSGPTSTLRPDKTTPGMDTSSLDNTDILSSIGEMAPMLYNLGRGLFGKKDIVNANRYNNPYEGQINSLMANRRYNIDPQLASNEAAFRTTSANMRNLGGSRGQVMSNLTGAQNTKQFGDMAAYSQQNNINNQYKGEQANMMYGLGRDTIASRMSTDEGNRMTDAAASNMVGAGMTGLQQYLLTRRQMKNQSARDRLLINAVKAYSPYSSKWIPGL